MLFRARLGAGDGVYRKALNGGADELLFTPVNSGSVPSDWSRDGRFIVYTEIDPKTQGDIWYVPLDGGKAGTPVKFLATDAAESQGQLSPDGRWLAYSSNESGNGAVYIRPFPSGPERWKVSAGLPAREPRWSHDGKELFFIENPTVSRNILTRVVIESDTRKGEPVGPSQKVFEYAGVTNNPAGNAWSYSVHRDGQRFVVAVSTDAGEPTLNVITNWRRAARATRIAP